MRRLFKSLLILLLGLPILVLIGGLYLQAQLKQAGISHWSADIRKWSLHQVVFSELNVRLEQPAYQLDVKLSELQLAWSWPAFFRIQPQTVLLHSASIHLQPSKLGTDTPRQNAIPLPVDWQIPHWVPQLVNIDHMSLTLPCADKHCELQGRLLISANEAQQWQAKLAISEPKQQLTLQADVFYEQTDNEKVLQSSFQLDQQLAISLKQQLNSNRQAQTELAIAIAPPSDALLAWLADWQLHIPTEWLAQFNQPVQLFAAGQWQVPDVLVNSAAQSLPIADAEFKLIARAPDPLIIPGLGWLKGEIDTQLSLKNHQVAQWQLNAALTLSHYDIHALDATTAQQITAIFGSPLAPINIALQSQRPVTSADNRSTAKANTAAAAMLFNVSEPLPINLRLSSVAPLHSELDATLLLSLEPELKLTLPQATLSLSSNQIHLDSAETSLSELRLNTQLSGFWQLAEWQLTLAENTELTGRISHPQAKTNARLQLKNTRLQQTSPAEINLQSQVQLSLSALEHALLTPQNWQWQAEIGGTPSQLAVTAELTNEKGLTIPHQFQRQGPNTFTVNWQIADLFLLAGNPLQETLIDWPELLTLNRGRLGAAGQLNYQDNSVTASAVLQLRELNGLYDRTLFNGLSSQVSIALADDQLTLEIPALQLAQLNHGLQMGPLQLSARYAAPLASLLTGKLDLTTLSMDFMQGTLAVAPQHFDLSAAEQQLVVTIQQLDLTELLRQHPTTDLSAHGKLSGRIPVTVKNGQWSVEQGSLAADQPGGRLQYRSAASAAGGANPGMKLVFDALADFHFSVLRSEVSYSQDGKLLLALQLQGANPAVQQGRAINLNINLEEDLPAMLASLQLANKLNDTLTKRVQQHIQRQQAAKAAAGETP